MFARFVMFGLCLVAGWLIWRALRRWIDLRSARPDLVSNTRQLGHRADNGRADNGRPDSGRADSGGSDGDGSSGGGD